MTARADADPTPDPEADQATDSALDRRYARLTHGVRRAPAAMPR